MENLLSVIIVTVFSIGVFSLVALTIFYGLKDNRELFSTIRERKVTYKRVGDGFVKVSVENSPTEKEFTILEEDWEKIGKDFEQVGNDMTKTFESVDNTFKDIDKAFYSANKGVEL